MSRGSVLALLAVSLGALGLVALAASRGSDDDAQRVTAPGQGRFRGGALPGSLDRDPAPSFSLKDARGALVSSTGLHGQPYLLTFLYTECEDVCPLIGQEIRQAFERLGPRADEVAAVAVSADPEGDTPDAVRGWLRGQRLPANFHYLIGSRDELAPVWRAYYAAPQPLGIDQSRHTASIWVIDAKGRLRTKFSGGVPVPPRDIAHDLRLLLGERGAA
jgi:protein SCO1/2